MTRGNFCNIHKRSAAENAARKRSRPRKLSVWEVCAFCVLPLMLIAAGAMPSVALVFMPFVLPSLYALYRRLGAYFPLAVVGGYGAFSLILNYDILTVVYFCGLFAALCGVIFSAQLQPYLLCATVAALFAVSGALAGAGIVRLAEGEPLGNVAENYVAAEYGDPVIGFAARHYYDNADLPAEVQKLERGDDGYDAAVCEFFGAYVNETASLYTWYYCLHFGAVIAAVGYFMSLLINGKTVCIGDCNADGTPPAVDTGDMGPILRERAAVSDMKIPRSYLWACLLPTFIATAALEIAGGYGALSATLMHAFVTLPTAFCFFTLLAYFASLFKGKAKVAARVVLVAVGMLMVVFPLALFIGSLIGVCDIILNLRFWTEFIRRE